MKEVIIASGPLVGKASMTLAYRVILTAYYNDAGEVVKYATHRQSFENGVGSKSDGRYFDGFNEPDKKHLRAKAVAHFISRVTETVTVAEEIPTLEEVLAIQN